MQYTECVGCVNLSSKWRLHSSIAFIKVHYTISNSYPKLVVKNHLSSTGAQKFNDFSNTFKDLPDFQALSRALNFKNTIQALSRISQALYEPCLWHGVCSVVVWWSAQSLTTNVHIQFGVPSSLPKARDHGSMHHLSPALPVPRPVWQCHLSPVSSVITQRLLGLPQILLPFNLPWKICIQIFWALIMCLKYCSVLLFTILSNSLFVPICLTLTPQKTLWREFFPASQAIDFTKLPITKR